MRAGSSKGVDAKVIAPSVVVPTVVVGLLLVGLCFLFGYVRRSQHRSLWGKVGVAEQHACAVEHKRGLLGACWPWSFRFSASYAQHACTPFATANHRTQVLAPTGPGTAMVITDIESSTLLWDVLDGQIMDEVLHLHHEVMRQQCYLHRGYESGTEGALNCSRCCGRLKWCGLPKHTP